MKLKMSSRASCLWTSKSTSSENGFASIQVLFIFSILALIALSFAFLSSISQAKMQFRKTCLSDVLEVERQIIQDERRLFTLNPLAKVLRMQLIVAQAQLAAATAVANPVAIAQATADIIAIQNKQIQLDRLQRSIILTAEANLISKTAVLTADYSKASADLSSRVTQFLKFMIRILPAQRTEFAVQPRTSGLAPEYELKPNYKALQAVAFNWQLNYFTTRSAQKFLDSANKFSLSCGFTADRIGDKWTLEIQKDRYF